MLLVDTSVWVDHFHRTDMALVDALESGRVLTHPMVIGELACGNLKARHEKLELLALLPQAPVAAHSEVLQFIDAYSLMGQGIGFIDAHLLASAALDSNVRLWTRDKRLAQAAARHGWAYRER